jgi:hypothetical protein
MISGRERESHGDRVQHREAVEEGKRPRREAIVRIECSTLRFRGCICRDQTNPQTTDVVGKGQGEYCAAQRKRWTKYRANKTDKALLDLRDSLETKNPSRSYSTGVSRPMPNWRKSLTLTVGHMQEEKPSGSQPPGFSIFR